MAKLHYINLMSLDGLIGDGEYDWSVPSEDFLSFITDITRPIGTYLNGRRTYETMAVWEKPEEVMPHLTPADLEFAQVWRSAEKIIYSKTLKKVSTQNTRLERVFNPQDIVKLKAERSKDLSVGGPTLAAQALQMNLVDEVHLFLVPVLLGKGIPVMPKDHRMQLELLDERRFSNGWLYLRYKTKA